MRRAADIRYFLDRIKTANKRHTLRSGKDFSMSREAELSIRPRNYKSRLSPAKNPAVSGSGDNRILLT